MTQMLFRKCDGDRKENEVAFAIASMLGPAYVFTSFPEEGIVKYIGSK